MRLISLELENFRQHASTKIDFNNGITTIIGANGSGKSTILEAISWAIYGTEAARGNKDSIVWNRASKNRVKVELIFAIDNEIYRVIRELKKAEVYLEPNSTPLAITQDEVTKYLTEKLGMTRTEFFNTYFTGQKDLDFLGNQKPTERKKFISKVLGYEKLKEAQDNVRFDKNNLNNELLGIKQGLGDFDLIQNEKTQIQSQIAEFEKDLLIKHVNLDKITLELGKLHPDWSKIQSIREDYNKYNTELKFLIDKFNNINKNIDEFNKEKLDIEAKSLKLQDLEAHLINYKKLEEKIKDQEDLQKHEIQRQKTLTNFENTEKELSFKEKQLSEISNSIESKKNVSEKLSALKSLIKKLNQDKQCVFSTWTAEKQEVKTLLKQKHAELAKIQDQITIIEQKGKEGACPTCERPLKDEFDRVISNFKSNIQTISKEIQELFAREDELLHEPSLIKEHAGIIHEKENEYEHLSKLQGQLEEEIKSCELLKNDITRKKELKIHIEDEFKKIPEGFNRELLENLKKDFNNLRKIHDEATGLKAQILNKDKINQALIKNENEKEEALKRKTQLENKLKEINYSEEEYKNLEKLVLETEKAAKEAENLKKDMESNLKHLKNLLERVLESEKSYKNKQEFIKLKQDHVNHLIELDRFYTYFLEKLNNQARPELSEIASEYLYELSGQRYSILELNDKYEICLKEDANSDIKPVISGGEEDIANLSLRLAISKMVAQRSGKTLSLIILDEVFGSLDEDRRNNVISLLRNLNNEFDQIILITHIDDFKDTLDNIIKVEYDEEQGCSQVKIINTTFESC